MNFRKALWGIVLILIGGLFIMDNFNIVDFHWASLLSLWPVVFVLWGISILPIKNIWKTIVSLIVLVVSLGYALQDTPENHDWWMFHHDRDMNVQTTDALEIQQERIPYDSTFSRAKLELDGAAGIFSIEDTSKEYLLDFHKKGNRGKYKIEPESEDDIYVVNIERDSKSVQKQDKFNKATIKLNDKPLWDIELNLGAADAQMDLSKFRVRDVDIEGGASDVNLKLGSKVSDIQLEVDAGASNFELQVPESSGCRLQAEAVLSNKDFEGFEKESSGLYLTKGYEDAENKIDIVVDAAISNFKIERY